MSQPDPASIQQKLRSNIPKIYFMSGSWMFLILMPVIVPFFQMHGMDMQEIFLLRAFFCVMVVILEVPSGYISDLMGRKQALILAGIFQGIGFTILAFSTTFNAFLVYELFNAIALSLFSGTDVALIYDSLEQLETNPHSQKMALGRRVFYSQVGETLAALAGGALAGISLALPAKVNAITVWGTLLIALTLYEPPRKRMSALMHIQNFRYIFRVLFKGTRILRLIIVNYVFLALSSYLIVWAIQGFWKDIGVPLSFFGYLWAGYNITVAITARAAYRIEEKLGSVPVLLIIGLLPIAAFAGMACFATWIGILFGVLFKVCRGLTQVVIKDALNTRVPTEIRATANSIGSLGVRLMFVIAGPFMGYMIDKTGYSSTFFTFAGLYTLVFFLAIVPLIGERRHFLNP